MDQHAANTPGRQDGANLPLRMAASTDDAQHRRIGPRKQSRGDPGGGTGAHGGHHGAVEQRQWLTRDRVEPGDKGVDRRQTAIDVARHDRHELHAGPLPAGSNAGHEQQAAVPEPDVRSQRRPIAAGRNVAIRRINRVQQFGDRHCGADRIGVEEGYRARHRSSLILLLATGEDRSRECHAVHVGLGTPLADKGRKEDS